VGKKEKGFINMNENAWTVVKAGGTGLLHFRERNQGHSLKREKAL